MSDYFPNILLPDSLKEFYKNWTNNIDKYIEPIEPKEPLKPEAPEIEKYELPTIMGLYLFIGFILFAFFKSLTVVVGGAIIWGILYTGYYLSTLTKQKVRQKVYDLAIIKYEQNLSFHKDQLRGYNRELISVREKKKDIHWLEQRRLEVTNLLMTPRKIASINFSSRKGSSENHFGSTLNHFFGNLISTNRVTEIFSYYQDDYESWELSKSKLDNAYVPDFIFKHDKSNMLIDIEIDEPYTFNEPIHTKGNERDRKRNEYFTSINWFVIRFSERQIIKYPERCCREIALLIKDYTGDFSFVNKIEITSQVPRDKMWTYSVAKDYIINKFRKNYSSLQDEKMDEKLFLGKWKCNGQHYLITSDQTIIETNESNNNETDRGHFKLKAHPCGRLVMTVQWKKNQTKYFLNHGWNQDLLLTNLYNREQITFLRE